MTRLNPNVCTSRCRLRPLDWRQQLQRVAKEACLTSSGHLRMHHIEPGDPNRPIQVSMADGCLCMQGETAWNGSSSSREWPRRPQRDLLPALWHPTRLAMGSLGTWTIPFRSLLLSSRKQGARAAGSAEQGETGQSLRGLQVCMYQALPEDISSVSLSSANGAPLGHTYLVSITEHRPNGSDDWLGSCATLSAVHCPRWQPVKH